MKAFPARSALVALGLVASASVGDARQSLITKVVPDDAAPIDEFGSAFALAGDTLFVGAPLQDLAGSNSGSVYVLRRDGLSWFLEQKIVPPNAGEHQAFGAELASDGRTLVVHPTKGFWVGDRRRGQLFVYERGASGWELVAQLRPFDDPGPLGGHFSGALAVAGDWIFAGAEGDSFNGERAGAVYTYRRTDAGWQPSAALRPADGEAGDRFGFQLDVEADTLVCTALFDEIVSGSVYVFERSGDAWLERQKLVAGPHPPGVNFGNALALDGDRLVIGVPLGGRDGPGTVQIFERGSGVWTRAATLTAPGAPVLFGRELAASAGAVLVEALFEQERSAILLPVVQVFRREGGEWRNTAELHSPDSQELGMRLATSGDLLAIAGPLDDQRALDAGAVSLYSLSGDLCATLSAPRELSWGKQRLEIDRGPEHAGHFYWLGGSTSGTLRGVAYQGTRIPLNMDAYFRTLVRHPNEGLFTNNFGVLDANGRAELVLKIPLDLYAGWSGLNLDHAFVEYGPDGFEHVSNAVALRFGGRP